jgi:hypothetical protein
MQFHIYLPKGMKNLFQEIHCITREPVTCVKYMLYYCFRLQIIVYMYVSERDFEGCEVILSCEEFLQVHISLI